MRGLWGGIRGGGLGWNEGLVADGGRGMGKEGAWGRRGGEVGMPFLLVMRAAKA